MVELPVHIHAWSSHPTETKSISKMLNQSADWEQWEPKCINSCQVFLHGRHLYRSILIPYTSSHCSLNRNQMQLLPSVHLSAVVCMWTYVCVCKARHDRVSVLKVYNCRRSRDSMFDTWDCKHLSHSIRFTASFWEQLAFSAVRSSRQRLTKAFTELERCVRSLQRLHRNFSGPHPVPRLALSEQLLPTIWV